MRIGLLNMKKRIKKWIDKHINYSLVNKNVFVTGGNSGIGLEAARSYLYLKCNLYLLARNIEKANKAKKELLKEFPDSKIEIIKLDLASFKSIKECVDYIIKNHIDIDVFLNNAGVFHLPYSLTEDGLEIVMGTNAVGTYYLNQLLMGYIKSLNHHVDVIFVSSILSKYTKLNYDDFFLQKHYKKMEIYSNSKLAVNEIYLYFLNEYKNNDVYLHLSHPGVTYTPLMNKGYKISWFKKLAHIFVATFFHSAAKAGLSDVYPLNFNRSVMVGPRGLFEVSGYPKLVKYKFDQDYMKCINIINEAINGK